VEGYITLVLLELCMDKGAGIVIGEKTPFSKEGWFLQLNTQCEESKKL